MGKKICQSCGMTNAKMKKYCEKLSPTLKKWQHVGSHKTISGREITYFGAENTKSIKRKCTNAEVKITTIDELFNILLNCWERKTAYPSCQQDKNYDFCNDPTYGQCAITAMLVCDMFGGTIHKIRVDGGGTHYFNKINGQYLDLTSDQFDLYNIPVNYEPNEEIPREYCGKNKDTLERFTLLKANIIKYLS